MPKPTKAVSGGCTRLPGRSLASTMCRISIRKKNSAGVCSTAPLGARVLLRMAANTLIDTSAMIALLNRAEPAHVDCVEALGAVALPLGVTQAVLTELFYFVGEDRRRREDAWRLISSEIIENLAITSVDFPRLEALMAKYADRPMDYADATLVHCGDRQGIATILTLDRSDFATYRMSGRRKFLVLPSR
ncbi:MAG: PIN domain-containing protein [Hyphomicrobiaceae bacterium]|nr:MAG: PIN domain-containing protein [Hyphomicrobiaceae bacterium]